MNGSTLRNAGRRRLLAGSAGALATLGLGAAPGTARAQGGTAQAPSGAGPAHATPPTGAAPPSPASKPLPAYVAWKNADAVIVHSSNTIETKRTAFGDGVITPADQLYIRNNVSPPDASILKDRDAWTLGVDGVQTPREITVGELKTMGLVTIAAVLQCSGNGRKFFPHKPSGTPWNVGAAGCVMWSGVPVRQVVEAMGGVAGGARYMTGRGGEILPTGIDANTVMVERSVPLDAMQDALLAWEMNGEPLTLAHGGPLRLVVPGYSGVNNVKYIKRLAFTPEQTRAAIQDVRYRLAPVGAKETSQQPAVWQMDVKSWINGFESEGTLPPGPYVIRGVAFGGMDAVKSVDVSIDGGKTWRQAAFVGPDLGKYAWRQFALRVDLKPGDYVFMSRATDIKGNVQAEYRNENEAGYLNSSWRDHALNIKVSA
ncbi:SorT family sulfite dehydrogenase catalytic subunit [Bordetella genomosp. 11]|uniref:Sulfite oxidase n=1 Tax=Bordetella genomosp. 11 TaxID=1416808 RepID=A0A261UYL2_9BORD|nr:sulfite oxidase [Bordetella genomosp. 11]OZI66974.1 sulfite oxidase [Bordetella genomosp. 11]